MWKSKIKWKKCSIILAFMTYTNKLKTQKIETWDAEEWTKEGEKKSLPSWSINIVQKFFGKEEMCLYNLTLCKKGKICLKFLDKFKGALRANLSPEIYISATNVEQKKQTVNSTK